MSSSVAKVSESECETIRRMAGDRFQELYFQKHGFPADPRFYPLKGDINVLRDYVDARNGARIRFVYFVKDEQPATFVVVQQRHQLDERGDRWDFVKTYNNIRDVEKTVPFDDYQAFHQKDVAGPQYRVLTQWLHLAPGFFVGRDFINSRKWPHPRRFFAFDQEQQGGDHLRTYLLYVRGFQPRGSCIDFVSHVSRAARLISIGIRALRQHDDHGDKFQQDEALRSP
jgi:hypothetical protein